MTDRKIKKAALCIAMSLVLAICGCAAAAPAAGQGSAGKEEAGQESTMQANAGQEAAGQEAVVQETTSQEVDDEELTALAIPGEDVFNYEEGDLRDRPSDPVPESLWDLLELWRHCCGGNEHSRQRHGAG